MFKFVHILAGNITNKLGKIVSHCQMINLKENSLMEYPCPWYIKHAVILLYNFGVKPVPNHINNLGS